MHCPRIPWDREGNLTTMDPVVMQAVITRGVKNCCAIPEGCDAGLFVHSEQVQVRETKISNEDCKIKQDKNGDIDPMLKLVKGKKHLQYTSKTVDFSGMHVLLNSEMNCS